MIGREFLDRLVVKDVMEDWGPNERALCATTTVQHLIDPNSTDEEKTVLVEAMHILCPGSFFAMVGDELGARIGGPVPVAVKFGASFVEEIRDGALVVTKERDRELRSAFVEAIREARKRWHAPLREALERARANSG
jgi:hypothetical protein